jgi:hypothetical protein
VEDRVRMVRVLRLAAGARADPAWANPRHPSPLSVPMCPFLPGSPVSGTVPVPAPPGRTHGITDRLGVPQSRQSWLPYEHALSRGHTTTSRTVYSLTLQDDTRLCQALWGVWPANNATGTADHSLGTPPHPSPNAPLRRASPAHAARRWAARTIARQGPAPPGRR